MVRVAVVDDHPVARYGIRAMLEPAADVDIVAVVATRAELPDKDTGSLPVDVVMLDLYPDQGAPPALATITELSATVPVLVFSASQQPADVLAAMQAGASGYLTKHASRQAYLDAIRAVAAGRFHFSAHLADILDVAHRAPTVDHEPLSPREQETLTLIARGLTHQQAAKKMGVSKATVDTYVARIRGKLRLGNKAELTIAALRYLDVDPGQPDG